MDTLSLAKSLAKIFKTACLVKEKALEFHNNLLHRNLTVKQFGKVCPGLYNRVETRTQMYNTQSDHNHKRRSKNPEPVTLYICVLVLTRLREQRIVR